MVMRAAPPHRHALHRRRRGSCAPLLDPGYAGIIVVGAAHATTVALLIS
jgi:hypothetical protein